MSALVRLYLEGKAQETRDAAPVEGGRNNYLTSVAGKLRNAGLGEDALTPALLQHNDDVCQPPLSDDEVRQIAHSVSRYPVPEPVGKLSLAHLPTARARRLADPLSHAGRNGACA